MAVRALTPSEAVEIATDVLGLDGNTVDLSSAEFVAAALRRAASFLCPISPRMLIQVVGETVAGLPGHSEETVSALEDAVEALLLYGDLLELPAVDQDVRRRHLYLGPPAFIVRQSGVILLTGIRPEGAPLLSGSLADEIEYDLHVRRLPTSQETTMRELIDDGLILIQVDQWLRCPPKAPPQQVVEGYATRVLSARIAGNLEAVRILDPIRPPTFYRGRWREIKPTDTGMYVARRSQGYGSDLWCVLDVNGGDIERGVDMPVYDPLAPGADEAWRLQAAIDAERNHPQRLAVRPGSREGSSVIDLFSPIPSWAQRRLDAIAVPIPKSSGALISYSVSTAELAEEVQFLKEMMWLEVVTGDPRSSG